MTPANESRQPVIQLPVMPEEASVLRFALDHALYEISEAHPEDRAQIKALIQRLEQAERESLIRSRRRVRWQAP